MKTVCTFFTYLLLAMFSVAAHAQTFTPQYHAMTSKTNGYYEYLPQGYDSTKSDTYPLLFWMSGIGELGNGRSNLPLILKWGVPKEIQASRFPASFTVGGQVFRFIVIAPQFIKFPRPTAEDMDSALNYIVAHYKVDLNRIYITGMSYGGGLCWAYTGANATNAQRIAAIVPVASPIPDGGDSTIFARSRTIAANNVPVWATHNLYDHDDTSATTVSYVNYINQPPAPTPLAKKTIFNAYGHNAWDKTYNISFREAGLNIYEWMLQYKRNIVAQNSPPVAAAGADQTITLPANSATLQGSGSDADGNIAAYNWSQVSGPSIASISAAAAATTTVSGLIQGIYTFRLTVTDNKGATAIDDVAITVVAAPNKAPVAAAGADVTVTLPTNSVTLTGTGTDSDGSIIAFAWTKISGPADETIAAPNAASTIISNLAQGSYVFRLTVTDNDGATAADDVTITVAAAPNKPPVVTAGTDQTITLPATSVTLSGTAADSDGTITKLAWTKTSGPDGIVFATPDKTTTAISGLVPGVYVVRLTATDNDNAVAYDEVTIIVNSAANRPPVANAGADTAITLPVSTVHVSGSGTDADGTITAYAWTKKSGPAGGVIASPAAAETDITGLVAGIYIFQLAITDNGGATATDDVTITVNAAPNQPPVAHAGTAQTITLPLNQVTLSGSGTDADGTITRYLWSKLSGPAAGVITSPNTAQTAVTNLAAGSYVFRLMVADNGGDTASADVAITVLAVPVNKPPVANAGADDTLKLPANTIVLRGSGSDSDGQVVSFLWTKISGPAGGDLATPASDSTIVSNLQQGRYVFGFTVTDDKGAMASDSVVIIVQVVTAVGETPDGSPFEIVVAPNPSPAYFSVKFQSSGVAPAFVRITDAVGRVVETRNNVSRNTTFSIGQQYGPGVYFIEVVQKEKKKTARLVKL